MWRKKDDPKRNWDWESELSGVEYDSDEDMDAKVIQENDSCKDLGEVIQGDGEKTRMGANQKKVYMAQSRVSHIASSRTPNSQLNAQHTCVNDALDWASNSSDEWEENSDASNDSSEAFASDSESKGKSYQNSMIM